MFKLIDRAVDPVRMKEALIAMQKDKLEMQKRFNDLVLENKSLRESTCRYEPRLAEIDQAYDNILSVKAECTEVCCVFKIIMYNL